MNTPTPQSINPFTRQKQMFTLLLVLIVLIGGVFGTMKIRQFLGKRASAAAMEQSWVALQSQLEKEQKTFAEALAGVQSDKKEFQARALTILPEDEKYIELTKELDDFFEKNFRIDNEIVASNLRFGTLAVDPAKPYAILPLSLTITATHENFEKFLRFVENSGSFEGGSRLLDLQAIRIAFEGEDQTDVSFSVELRAFVRNPGDAHGGTQ